MPAIDCFVNHFDRVMGGSAYARKNGGSAWRAIDRGIAMLKEREKWDRRALAPREFWFRMAIALSADECIPDKYLFSLLSSKVYGMINGYNRYKGRPLIYNPIPLAEQLGLAASWRPGKDVVIFDEDARREMAKSTIDDAIQPGFFLHMPSWAIWFDAPGIEIGGEKYEGFLAGLSFGPREDSADDFPKGDRLAMCFLREEQERKVSLRHLALDLECPTIRASIERGINESVKAAGSIERQVERGRIEEELASGAIAAHRADAEKSREFYDSPGVAEAVAMVIYTCSYGLHDRKDYRPGSDFRSHEPKKTKKGFRLHAAQEPSIWRMALEMGDIIRENAKYCKIGHSGLGGTKAPHYRRGHLRNQQCGPKESPFIKPVFIAPVFVKGHRDMPEDGAEKRKGFPRP